METFSRLALIRFICFKTSGLLNPQYPSHVLFDRAIVLIEIKTLSPGQSYFYRGTCCGESCQSRTRQVIN